MRHPSKDLSKFLTHGLSLESPLENQNDYLTPNEQFFVCNSGTTPQIKEQHYSLRVWGDGVFEELHLSYAQLQTMSQRTVPAIIECAGNHRLFFEEIDGKSIETPAGTEKLIWSTGAIGMADWRGVPLPDVLKLAGIRAEAIQLCARGGETDSCEGEVRIPMPINKAMDKDTLLAISMNGKPLPADHGFPVRVLVPGWIGAYSVKWLLDIEVSTQPIWVKRNTTSYVLKGDQWPAVQYTPSLGKPLTTQNIKTALALPYPAKLLPGKIKLHGYAHSPGCPIQQVLWCDANTNTWQEASLGQQNERYGWVRFEFEWEALPGDYQIITKAFDCNGHSQPDTVVFNAAGYLYNAVYPHPISVSDVD
ncbi:MAG: sulfane dehydrogenase subunit SoxC [Granulosicoccus sp.]|jgi:DMSO/TMAO reductase YedYZ molybdopterin-dependent catalytic subunit